MRAGIEYYNMMMPHERHRFKKAYLRERGNVFKDSDSLRDDFHKYLEWPYFTFNSFLGSAFIWKDSMKGHDYWEKVADKYKWVDSFVEPTHIKRFRLR
jgi:hypothetical protein